MAKIAQIERAWLRQLDQNGKRDSLTTLKEVVHEQEHRFEGRESLPNNHTTWS